MWDKNDWLYEGQHGFRSEYSCESQVAAVCQDTAYSLNDVDRIDAIIVDFSKDFDLVPRGRLLMKVANCGVVCRVVVWIGELLLGRTEGVRVVRQLSADVKSDVRCTARKRIGPPTVPSLRKLYLEEYGINY